MTTRIDAPLLLTVRDLIKLTGFSRTWIFSAKDRGAMPEPIRVGKILRWRRADIEFWIDCGCPSRSAFEAAKRER